MSETSNGKSGRVFVRVGVADKKGKLSGKVKLTATYRLAYRVGLCDKFFVDADFK